MPLPVDPDLKPVPAAQAMLDNALSSPAVPSTRAHAPSVSPAEPDRWQSRVVLRFPLLVDGQRLDSLTLRRLPAKALMDLLMEDDEAESLNRRARAAIAGVHGEVHATYRDEKTGSLKLSKQSTGLSGPARVLKEPFPDEARAKKAAEAEKGRVNRETGSCSFVKAGDPTAQAGAAVVVINHRSGLRGDWRASKVEHDFEPGDGGGYKITVSCKAREDGKRGKDDD